jgi:DNA-binding phage protein
MSINICEYLDEGGDSPFAQWFEGLDATVAAKVATALYRMERGNFQSTQDADFRRAILKEGIDTLLAGDVNTGKAILRDYINAAVGFGELADGTNMPAKSLMRMFGPKGNPRADNLFRVIQFLQDREGIHMEVVPH